MQVRNMVKHFKTAKGVFKAVDGVDVAIEPSSITALLGPSGSGKTTLLRLIAGLEQPTDGRIFFDDMDATDLSVQDRQIGFVFQSYALFNHMTVADNIKFGLQVGCLAVIQLRSSGRLRAGKL
jgi:sulfate transport system ATP-binding protein